MMCQFCGDDIHKGEGRIFVTMKGNAFYFCSKKCEKNQLKLRRKARKVKWTQEYRKEKEIRKRILDEREKSAVEQKKREVKEPKKSAKVKKKSTK